MTDTPAESAEDPRTPDWLEDETQCPCGSLAGPDFRYGLCDACAKQLPASALLRWGAQIGAAMRHERAALAARDAEWRKAYRGSHLNSLSSVCADLRALLSEWKPGK